MVQNAELEDVVLGALFHYMNSQNPGQNPVLKILSEGREESGKELLRARVQIGVDDPDMIIILYEGGEVIGYGFDFRQDGVSAKQAYEKAIANTGGQNSESIVAKGTIGDKFGWYITKR